MSAYPTLNFQTCYLKNTYFFYLALDKMHKQYRVLGYPLCAV